MKTLTYSVMGADLWLKTPIWKKWWFWGIIIIIIGILSNYIPNDNSLSNNNGLSDVDKRIAYDMSQKFVKDRLKSPATAKFPSYNESFVIDNGDGCFKVSSYMESRKIVDISV